MSIESVAETLSHDLTTERYFADPALLERYLRIKLRLELGVSSPLAADVLRTASTTLRDPRRLARFLERRIDQWSQVPAVA